MGLKDIYDDNFSNYNECQREETKEDRVKILRDSRCNKTFKDRKQNMTLRATEKTQRRHRGTQREKILCGSLCYSFVFLCVTN
jgi:hypothetical protein